MDPYPAISFKAPAKRTRSRKTAERPLLGALVTLQPATVLVFTSTKRFNITFDFV